MTWLRWPFSISAGFAYSKRSNLVNKTERRKTHGLRSLIVAQSNLEKLVVAEGIEGRRLVLICFVENSLQDLRHSE